MAKFCPCAVANYLASSQVLVDLCLILIGVVCMLLRLKAQAYRPINSPSTPKTPPDNLGQVDNNRKTFLSRNDVCAGSSIWLLVLDQSNVSPKVR